MLMCGYLHHRSVVPVTVASLFHYFTVYEAGKAVKKGMPNQYAPTVYAPSMYAQAPYGQAGMPLLPLPNGVGAYPPQSGYGHEYDASSGKNFKSESQQ